MQRDHQLIQDTIRNTTQNKKGYTEANKSTL